MSSRVISACVWNWCLSGVKNVTVDFGSKRHSLEALELSQRPQTAVQIVSNLPAPAMGARITVFGCLYFLVALVLVCVDVIVMSSA